MGLLRQQNLWKCDHCGKEEVWGPTWGSRLILHKSGGPGPWDEQIVACSQECREAIDEKRRWKKLPDKSKGEPAADIGGAALTPNAALTGAHGDTNKSRDA
jgi:hypothetical protein